MLRDLLRDPDFEPDPKDMSTMETFEAIFGRIYWPLNRKGRDHTDGVEVVRWIKGKKESILFSL
jgi:hypothetical protein